MGGLHQTDRRAKKRNETDRPDPAPEPTSLPAGVAPPHAARAQSSTRRSLPSMRSEATPSAWSLPAGTCRSCRGCHHFGSGKTEGLGRRAAAAVIGTDAFRPRQPVRFRASSSHGIRYCPSSPRVPVVLPCRPVTIFSYSPVRSAGAWLGAFVAQPRPLLKQLLCCSGL